MDTEYFKGFNDGRVEHDLLGKLRISDSCYFGVQTQRARENFQISGVPISHFHNLIVALAMVKQAAARANSELGKLSNDKSEVIERACEEIIAGKFHDQFVVDMIQGGAGTSTNMNANEVVANRALELLGHHKGEYQFLHPNNDVNMCQSTNDVYPTALRLAIILEHRKLIDSLIELIESFKQKGIEFSSIVKMGRTQLQDAVPMTLGQEFTSYAVTLAEEIERMEECIRLFKEINLGGTAIGTRLNASPEYTKKVVMHLSAISGTELVSATDLIEATYDMGAFILLSSLFKRTSIKLSKICNDLRLLSSGPRAGLNEINLPPMQPGSSIMPGKINPVIPETVNQVAFQVIGNDLTITIAAEAGQLQLNVMEPIIAFNIFESMRILIAAIDSLDKRCVKGITANPEVCFEYVTHSIGIITALNPILGYENASRIAKEALAQNRSIPDLILEEGLMTAAELEENLKPEKLVGN